MISKTINNITVNNSQVLAEFQAIHKEEVLYVVTEQNTIPLDPFNNYHIYKDKSKFDCFLAFLDADILVKTISFTGISKFILLGLAIHFFPYT